MSYQVLARKYRPQTFDEVVGQDAVVKTLHRALDGGRVAHAFLFTGSRGVGKTTLARILAKCLMCERGPTSKPCGVCVQCTSIAAGQSVDVVEIDGASNTGVDDVRELREVARYLPQSGRYKIFIIDEVHMLSTSAFNALLKTLEEPPPHVKFVFATTEPHKIPVTILSRCQRYDFKRIPTSTIVARLQDVLAAEKVKIDPRGLDVIARAAEGGMRDALSLTDQVLSFAGEDATAEQVSEALGIVDRRSVVAMLDAVIGGDARSALAVVENAFNRGVDLKQLLQRTTEELRHLSVASSAGTVRGLADLPDEEIAAIDARAKALDARDVLRLFAMAVDAFEPLSKAEDARLAVEVVVLRMCGRPPLGDAMAISEALVRLEALAKGRPVPPLGPRPPGGPGPKEIVRDALAAPASTAMPLPAPPLRADVANTDGEDEPVVADVAVPDAPDEEEGSPLEAARLRLATAPRAAAPVVDDAPPEAEDDEAVDPAAHLTLVGVDPRWKTFVDSLFLVARPISMYLEQAHVRRIDGGIVDVSFPRELHEKNVAPAVNDVRVVKALAAAFGDGTRLAVVKAAGPPPSPSITEAREAAIAAAQAALEEHARQHPVVAKAVALFGGEVRAVRTR